MQKNLFDQDISEQRKQDGMKLAAVNQLSNLELARSIAFDICQRRGTVTADDVGEVLFNDHGIKSLGPSAGSLFTDGRFLFTGVRVRSSRKKNHGRELKQWRLK